MMSVKQIILIAGIFSFYSCNSGKQIPVSEKSANVIIQPGHKLPPDSIITAKTILSGKPLIFNSGKAVVSSPQKNIFRSGQPKLLIEGPDYRMTDMPDSSIKVDLSAALGQFVESKPGNVVSARDAISRDRNPYSFSILGKLQGLNHNVINCMFQDRSGFLWVGSDGGGVSRYDGSSFTSYTEKNGLVNNYVYAIEEDTAGNIWIATRGGLSCFDGLNFTNFTTRNGLVNNRVQCLITGYNGEIILGTFGSGLIFFDGKEFRTIQFGDDTEINRIHAIGKAGNGEYWIGTEGGGIIRTDGKRFVNYHFNDLQGRNSIRNICTAKSGDLLFSTDGGGILIYESGSFRAITTETGLKSNSTTFVAAGVNDEIWIAYVLGGISMYNGSSFTHLTEEHGLVNNSIISILFDRHANMWLSAYGGGLARYQGGLFTHYTANEGLSNNNIYGVTADSKGHLWLGPFGGGLQKYDGSVFTCFPPVKGLTDYTVLSLKEDRNGIIWAATSGGGIYSFDGEKISLYKEDHGLADNYVFCIMEEKNGTLWFGTFGGGISKFDGKSFTNITKANGLSGNIILSIIEDSRGDIWIGTSGEGATRISNGEFIHYSAEDGLGSNNIYSIAEDIRGNIWFGTNEGGVTVFDGATFRTITESEGLSNNAVLAISSDRSGNIWFGTRNGLNRMPVQSLNVLHELKDLSGEKIREKLKIRTYLYEDGFIGVGCSRGSIACDIKGTVWIGANDMLTAYHPEGEKNNALATQVYITGVELFDENIPWKELYRNNDSVLILESGMEISRYRISGITKWYGLPVGLSLSHRNNYLTFSFTGIADYQNKKLRYQYRLEGLEQGWSLLSEKSYASFGNLPPGEYNFIVRAQNRLGIWSRESEFGFEVRPPFTGTIFFRVLLIITILLFIAVLFRRRVATLRSQKAELEREVSLKTAEVVMQNKELQRKHEELEVALSSLRETQKQLIISEKMASLGVLAAGVAHEINNPLNFIHGGALGIEKYFSEKQPDNVKDIEQYLDVINIGIKRAAEIVTSLNRFSRQDETQRLNCDIHVIIDNCLRILQNELKNRVTISKDYTSGKYELIGNEGKLHQAILNILTNASQAIAKSGSVSIKTDIVDSKMTITVKDSGVGISKEMLPRIMDPFFTTKEPGKGTGLGLSITYNIIKEHDGTIEIDSEPGKGTSVTIKLPVQNS